MLRKVIKLPWGALIYYESWPVLDSRTLGLCSLLPNIYFHCNFRLLGLVLICYMALDNWNILIKNKSLKKEGDRDRERSCRLGMGIDRHVLPK